MIEEEKKVAITIRHLMKKYGHLVVLNDLDLDIYEGETLVILGRSGSGKSVLLKQIIGIETPNKGYIEVNGVRLTDINPNYRYRAVRNMGMLFQGAALFDSMNVFENTAFYLRQHERHLKENEIKERVDEALEMVGLSGTQFKMPSDLSGGMRKRAALARLIVYRPTIILYDEPTTGLDPITSMQINELILETQKKLRATSIVVTHDIRSAMEVGDRLAFHDEGKIRQIAPKNEFIHIHDPLLRSFFENASLTYEELTEIKKEFRQNHD